MRALMWILLLLHLVDHFTSPSDAKKLSLASNATTTGNSGDIKESNTSNLWDGQDLTGRLNASLPADECVPIEAILKRSGTEACRCFSGVPDFDNLNLDFLDPDRGAVVNKNNHNTNNSDNHSSNGHEDSTHIRSKIWIGCSKSKMPQIISELNSLPENTLLSKLWIWNNLISVLQPAFSKVKTEKLIIEQNRLQGLSPDKHVFKTTAPYLRHLILRNNVIARMEKRFLQDFVNLRTLDLSFNAIEVVDESSFGIQLHELRFLSLKNNRIVEFTGSPFSGFSNLENLNLGNNRIKNLPSDAFKGLQHLKVLNLMDNQLESLPDDLFRNTPNLHSLKLGGNTIKSISLQMPNLKQLFLNKNYLESMPKLNCPSLELLNLDENGIHAINRGWSQDVPALKVLSLSTNIITEISGDSFKGLTSLSVLSLHNNSLTTVNYDTFSTTPNLHKLMLSENSLAFLSPETFSTLRNLNVLNLAGNRLVALRGWTLPNSEQLMGIYLNRNELTSIDQTSRLALSNVKLINLADNPFPCDCSLIDLSIWASEHQSKLINLNGTRCLTNGKDQNSDSNSHILAVDRVILGTNEENRNDNDALLINFFNGSFAKSCPLGSIETSRSREDGGSPFRLDGTGSHHGPSLVTKVVDDKYAANSVWITVLAFVLGISSVLTLSAVAYLFVKDAAKLKKLSSSSSLSYTHNNNINSDSGLGLFGGCSSRNHNNNGRSYHYHQQPQQQPPQQQQQHHHRMLVDANAFMKRIPSDMVNLLPKDRKSSSLTVPLISCSTEDQPRH